MGKKSRRGGPGVRTAKRGYTSATGKKNGGSKHVQRKTYRNDAAHLGGGRNK
jgi:hypothetical protein